MQHLGRLKTRLIEYRWTLTAIAVAFFLVGLHLAVGYGDPAGRLAEFAGIVFDIVLGIAAVLMVLTGHLFDRSKKLMHGMALSEGARADLENDLAEATLHAIRAFARAIDARDHFTAHHSGGVASIANKIAQKLNLEAGDRSVLWQAGLVHDVGKIGVPDDVLLKPGRLTDDEYELIKRHPEMGVSLLKPIRGLEDVLQVVQTHHERYDGKGYPYGLAGEQIPLLGRIMAVADAFEAMTSPRVYRRHPLSYEEAAKELVRGSGSQFDPKIVEVMLELMEEEGRLGTSLGDAVAEGLESA